MKSKPIISIITAFSSALIACQEEDILQDKLGARHETIHTQVSKHDEGGFFKDVTGFDPALQSQLIEMSFPVTVEGVQTNIDAQFSVMPIHVYEDSGADKSGDYYVVEADFTAHNAPLKEHNLFMKSMDVSVTPTSANDVVLTEGTDVLFYDMPSPKTTIMNSSYKDSHSQQINGGFFIGKAPMWIEKEMPYYKIWPGLITMKRDLDFWKEKYNLRDGITYIEDIQGNRYSIDPRTIDSRGVDWGSDILIQKGTLDLNGNRIPDDITEKLYRLFFDDIKFEATGNIENNIIRLYKENEQGIRETTECIDTPIRGKVESYTEENIDYTNWRFGVKQGMQKQHVPEFGFFATALIGGGFTWSVNQIYYREDLTTRLNTDSHCGVDYKYVVENLDSSKGIPRVAQSDLNGHATWVWRMPVNASKFSADQLLSNLFKVKMEVHPIYGKVTKLDKEISYDATKSTTMQTSVLSAPYRHKMTSIRFTNHGISPMMNVRLLTVPYLKWVEDGRPESEVLQQREDPLMPGESIIMPTVETSCYIACEEVDPQSLKVKSVRQSELIDVKIGAKSSQEIRLSTFDTTPVMVYKN